MKNWQEEFLKAQDFLRDCEKKRVHIFHDSDADGIGAGLQLFHTLKRLKAKPTISTHAERDDILSKEAYEAANALSPQRVIIADVNPISNKTYDLFKEIFPDTPTLIIDHHHVEPYTDEVYVHGGELNNVEGADYCTAKIAYDICTSVLSTAQDFAWLAATGIIGDMNQEYFESVIRTALVQESFDPDQNVYSCELSVVNESIHCCEARDNQSLQNYLQDLQECETLKEAIKLGNPHPEIIEEFHNLVSYAETQVSDKVINWIDLDTQFGIAGWVADTVSIKHPETIFAIYHPDGDRYTMSLRNQSRKVHLGEISRKCSEAVGGSGGGHKPAAGAKVPKEQLTEFQQLVEQEVINRL